MITVRASTLVPNKNVEIWEHDAELIRRIAANVGFVDAVRVTRWLVGCSIGDAKAFVGSLRDSAQQNSEQR